MGNATKYWSYSVGERGRNRVRAFEHPATARLFLEFYEPARGGGKPRPRRVALGHRDRERAKAAAEELAAALRRAEPPRAEEHIRLATLFDIYVREVTPTKGGNKQRHDRTCAELFLRAFGRDTEARTLSRREWDRFILDRRAGVLRPAKVKKRRVVGDRVIGYDLQWLVAVLNWATRASDGRGGVLLERNPLAGLDLPRTESPRRPVLDAAQYAQLLRKAPLVSPLFHLAVVLAHETGHRIGAIRQLRWSDVDLREKRVTWRAENDKIGFAHVTPLSDAAVMALEMARVAQRAIGDTWIFPAPGDPTEPCSRHLMRDWWERGAKAAELPEGERLGFHALRRAFATELKEVPLKDLCYLGGWKDPQTVLRCYQQPDEHTMRTALEQRKQVQIGVAR